MTFQGSASVSHHSVAGVTSGHAMAPRARLMGAGAPASSQIKTWRLLMNAQSYLSSNFLLALFFFIDFY